MSPNLLPPVLRPENLPARALLELAQFLDAQVLGDASHATIHGVTLATADLRPGEAFVAVNGRNRHGAEFAQHAADLGATAIVTDAAGAALAQDTGLPVLVIENPRAALGAMSAWVFGTSAEDDIPLLFGVTGSNGKTSTCHFIDGLLA